MRYDDVKKRKQAKGRQPLQRSSRSTDESTSIERSRYRMRRARLLKNKARLLSTKRLRKPEHIHLAFEWLVPHLWNFPELYQGPCSLSTLVFPLWDANVQYFSSLRISLFEPFLSKLAPKISSPRLNLTNEV
jgi:hypothetical protein